MFPFATTTAAEDTTHHYPSNILIANASSAVAQYRVVSETIRIVTAYNAGDPHQNDGNPCISANGEDLCRALASGQRRCAANFVPLGTKLYIETYGICEVTDRTNRRYRNRVDIAMRLDERRKAIQFGKRKLKVKILKKILAQATPIAR